MTSPQLSTSLPADAALNSQATGLRPVDIVKSQYLNRKQTKRGIEFKSSSSTLNKVNALNSRKVITSIEEEHDESKQSKCSCKFKLSNKIVIDTTKAPTIKLAPLQSRPLETMVSSINQNKSRFAPSK